MFSISEAIGRKEGAITRSNLVKTLATWGPEFCIYFELYINSFKAEEAWHSIIHFTTGGNAGSKGTRYPGVWAGWKKKSGTILFVFDEYKCANVQCPNFGQVDGFKTNHWYKIGIEQKLDESVSIDSIKIASKLI